MDIDRTKVRKAVHGIMLLALVLSVYVVGVLMAILTPGMEMSFLPWRVLAAFFTRFGVAWKLCLLLWLILAAIAVYEYHRYKAGERKADKLGREIKYADYQPYGDAHFAEPEEYRHLAQIRPIEEARGIVLGRLSEDGSSECIDLYQDPDFKGAKSNSNMFVIGASGTGKSFSLVKTYCLQAIKAGRSIIITDPKGELHQDMAKAFKAHGYIVRRLNFCDPLKSDGWDAMKSLRTDDELSREINADIFADAIVSNITEKRDIYYTGPRMLLKALVLRLILDPTLTNDQKNIKTLYQWVSSGQAAIDALFDKQSMPPETKPSLAPYTTFKGSSANLAGNLITNLGAGMSILSTGIIADMLSTDDIDVKMAAERPCAIFVQFPVGVGTYRFPMALFFTMTFISLMGMANSQPKKRLPRMVDFVLDEFPQVGILPNWDERMSTIRSYGINACMICQTLSQFKDKYKDSWETIISNCATWILLGANDETTAEYFSRRVGETSVQVETQQVEGVRRLMGMNSRPTDRSSVGVGRTSLLPAKTLLELPSNVLVILFQRHNPILAYVAPWILHPYHKDAEETLDDELPDFRDAKTRRTLQQQEGAAIEEYWQHHKLPDPYAKESISDTDDYYAMREDPFYMIKLVLKEDLKGLSRGVKKLLGRDVEIEPAQQKPKSGGSDASVKAGAMGLFQGVKAKREAERNAKRSHVLGETMLEADFDLDDDFDDELEDDEIQGGGAEDLYAGADIEPPAPVAETKAASSKHTPDVPDPPEMDPEDTREVPTAPIPEPSESPSEGPQRSSGASASTQGSFQPGVRFKEPSNDRKRKTANGILGNAGNSYADEGFSVPPTRTKNR